MIRIALDLWSLSIILVFVWLIAYALRQFAATVWFDLHQPVHLGHVRPSIQYAAIATPAVCVVLWLFR